MKNRPFWNYHRVWAACLGGVAVAITGCGGGGGSVASFGFGGFTHAAVPISWALRAGPTSGPASIAGPSAALSVVVTFDSASYTHQNVSLEADRNASPAAYHQIYRTTQGLKSGVLPIHVRFYSEPGAQGGLVASADASVLVQENGTLAQANGSLLTSIQTTGQISSVSIQGLQSISVGTSQAITTQVFDAQNNLLAVSPGSIFYQVLNGTGSATIDSNGKITGVQTGTVTVTATVDGISSAPDPVNVLATSTTLTSFAQQTSSLAINPANGNIWATVPATDSTYGNTVIEIDAKTQKIISSIYVGSSPTVLAFSTDGSVLYVGLQGSDSFAKVDPIAKKLIATYPVGSTGFGGPQYPISIAVEPGNPNVVALCLQDDGDSGFTGGCIYNNGVLLPNSFGVYGGSIVGFSDSTTLWSSSDQLLPPSVVEGKVDSKGVTTVNSNRGLGGVFSIFGGNLYFTNGEVISGSNGNLLGTFPVQYYGKGVAVDTANQITYIVELSYYTNSYQLYSFGTSDFRSIATYAIPSGPSAVNGFSLLKSGKFVFEDGSNIYFMQLPSSPSTRQKAIRPR